METFRKRLTEIIKNNNVNQSELAKRLNIERQGITNYKNGSSIPSLDTFKNLCIELDVSADYLLGLIEYDGTIKADDTERENIDKQDAQQAQVINNTSTTDNRNYQFNNIHKSKISIK